MAALDYRDFYIRYPQHEKYSPTDIVTADKMDMIVGKLEMVLFTNKGDFIGDPNFGCSLDFYLWQTNVPATRIETVIREQIDLYIPELNSLGYQLQVSLISGEIRDIMLVDITVSDQTIQAVLR